MLAVLLKPDSWSVTSARNWRLHISIIRVIFTYNLCNPSVLHHDTHRRYTICDPDVAFISLLGPSSWSSLVVIAALVSAPLSESKNVSREDPPVLSGLHEKIPHRRALGGFLTALLSGFGGLGKRFAVEILDEIGFEPSEGDRLVD